MSGVHTARVQAGQHLVRVECGAIERELEARKSDLAAAEAFYLRTLHGPRLEEISVGVANVNLAEARLQEAVKALRRTQQLQEGFTVTRVQIDQAQRDARMDEALLDELRAKLALLKAGSREEDITEARSRRDGAKGRMEEAAHQVCTLALFQGTTQLQVCPPQAILYRLNRSTKHSFRPLTGERPGSQMVQNIRLQRGHWN